MQATRGVRILVAGRLSGYLLRQHTFRNRQQTLIVATLTDFCRHILNKRSSIIFVRAYVSIVQRDNIEICPHYI